MPTLAREDLCARTGATDDNRTGLAAFAHLTDTHVLDAANPGRLSFLWQYFDFDFHDGFPISGLFRPQDLLTVQVLDAMLRKINAVGRGPVCQRSLDCLVVTGDLTNSFAISELTAAVGVFEGKSVNPHPANTYEGVQDHGPAPLDLSQRIWHPAPEPALAPPDKWKALYGYPTVPGLLEAAILPVRAEGSRFPWYIGFGNHDEAGRSPSDPLSRKTQFIDMLRTGNLLPVQLPPGMNEEEFWERINDTTETEFDTLIESLPSRTVSGSNLRREFSKADFKNSQPTFDRYDHSAAPSGRSGDDRLYYTFDISSQVLGVMLNTASPDGGGIAVMDTAQAAWLEEQLEQVSGKSYDAQGNLTARNVEDRLVVLFSHHPLSYIEEVMERSDGSDPTLDLSSVLELISRFPNVLAWMNGHSHKHRVTPHKPDHESGGFWEITTASLIDYPQQSRIVELIDNGDGTLSIVATLIDHSAPQSVLYKEHSPRSMAALSLELAINGPGLDPSEASGSAEDQNVDLIIKRPF